MVERTVYVSERELDIVLMQLIFSSLLEAIVCWLLAVMLTSGTHSVLERMLVCSKFYKGSLSNHSLG